MPPVRTEKHTKVPWKRPPKTPYEFRLMVKWKCENTTLVQSSESETSQTTCAVCINNIIKTKSTRNRLSIRVDERTSPMRFLGHRPLQLDELVTASTPNRLGNLTDSQRKATKAFLDMIEDQSEDALLQRLGRRDTHDVKEWEMERLMILLSQIFFQITPWDRMEVFFRFEDATDDPHVLGTCSAPDRHGKFHDDKVTVRMSPCTVKSIPGFRHLNGRTMSRLSTLVHELVHAYINMYACISCLSYQEDVDQLDGHGRVWQRIARRVEWFVEYVLHLPLRLGRFTAIVNNLENLKVWPTEKEAKWWYLK